MPELECPICGRKTAFFSELIGRELFCLGCGSHFVASVNVSPVSSLTVNPAPTGDARTDEECKES